MEGGGSCSTRTRLFIQRRMNRRAMETIADGGRTSKVGIIHGIIHVPAAKGGRIKEHGGPRTSKHQKAFSVWTLLYSSVSSVQAGAVLPVASRCVLLRDVATCSDYNIPGLDPGSPGAAASGFVYDHRDVSRHRTSITTWLCLGLEKPRMSSAGQRGTPEVEVRCPGSTSGAPDGWTQQTTDAWRWRSRRFHSEHGSYRYASRGWARGTSVPPRILPQNLPPTVPSEPFGELKVL